MTPQEILREYFGYDSFRPGQLPLIEHMLAGEDVLGIMPTGAGKSVCYQVPAMLLPGLTIVISPLISLMLDQVTSLRQNGIPAAYLNSSMTEEEIRRTLHGIYDGRIRLLYAAPERLSSPGMQRIAREVPVSMLTVDEAHCVSQWGQDFRPSYLNIVDYLRVLPRRPVISAFTAPAPREVADDILRILGLHEPFRLTTGFDRSNLFFGVEQPPDKFRALCRIVQQHEGESGIVYCLSRKLVEEVTQRLCDAGIPAGRYHAGLSDAERTRNQEDFLYDRIRVMVATNAFGMGIDKSDVRFVVHYNMPRNLESYYQEAGRAGRDGIPADCILLYSGQDVRLCRFLLEHSAENEALDEAARIRVRAQEEERLRRMTFYSTGHSCLRQTMLQYFGENAPPVCGNCSVCRGSFDQEDITVEAQKIVSCVYRLQKRGLQFGRSALADILVGSKAERYEKFRFESWLSTWGILPDMTRKHCTQIIDFLLAEGWLCTGGEYNAVQLCRRSAELLRERPALTMKVLREQPPREERRSSSGAVPDPALYQALRDCRARIAAKEHVPAYIIFTDAALQDMCRKRPTSEMAFLSVSGVGQVKLHKYGAAFMEIIRQHGASGAHDDS